MPYAPSEIKFYNRTSEEKHTRQKEVSERESERVLNSRIKMFKNTQ